MTTSGTSWPSQLDEDGVWRPAIPEPFYISARRWRWLPFPRIWLHRCCGRGTVFGGECGRTYIDKDDYRLHWRREHGR